MTHQEPIKDRQTQNPKPPHCSWCSVKAHWKYCGTRHGCLHTSPTHIDLHWCARQSGSLFLYFLLHFQWSASVLLQVKQIIHHICVHHVCTMLYQYFVNMSICSCWVCNVVSMLQLRPCLLFVLAAHVIVVCGSFWVLSFDRRLPCQCVCLPIALLRTTPCKLNRILSVNSRDKLSLSRY